MCGEILAYKRKKKKNPIPFIPDLNPTQQALVQRMLQFTPYKQFPKMFLKRPVYPPV